MKRILLCSCLIALWGTSVEASGYVGNQSDEGDVTFTMMLSDDGKNPVKPSGGQPTKFDLSVKPKEWEMFFHRLGELKTSKWNAAKDAKYLVITVKAPGLTSLPCPLDGHNFIDIDKDLAKVNEIFNEIYATDIIFKEDKEHHTNSKCIIQKYK